MEQELETEAVEVQEITQEEEISVEKKKKSLSPAQLANLQSMRAKKAEKRKNNSPVKTECISNEFIGANGSNEILKVRQNYEKDLEEVREIKNYLKEYFEYKQQKNELKKQRNNKKPELEEFDLRNEYEKQVQFKIKRN